MTAMDEHDKRAREWYAQELNEQPPDCACYEQHIESLVTLLRSTAAAAVAAERERCARVCDDEAVEAGRGRPNTVGCARMLAARIRGGAPAQAEQRVSEDDETVHLPPLARRRAMVLGRGTLSDTIDIDDGEPDPATAERQGRALPVLRSCGDCAHYADVRDGQCEHPFQRPFPETGRNDAPPAWCPLRRST